MGFFRSIRFKIIVVLGAVLGVVAIADQLWVQPRTLRRAISRAQDDQLTSAMQLAANVELYLRGARAELELVARSPHVVAMEKSRLDVLLQEMTERSRFFNYFFVTDTLGRWVSYPSKPELIGEHIPEANRAWVHRAVESRQTVFLDVTRSRIGTLVSGFAAPVSDLQGKVVGVVRGVFDVSTQDMAAELLKRVRVGRRGQAFLVDGNGWLLAHPNVEIDYARFDAMDYSRRPAVQQLLRGNAGVTVEHQSGESWVVAHAPVSSAGWGVIVEQPEQEIVDEVKRDGAPLHRLFLGGFLIGTILLLGGLQFTLRPLSRLVAALSTGLPVDLETNARDEIGVVSRQLSALYQQALASREALRESEEKYRNIVRQSVDGIVIIDGDGLILEWNDSLARLTGLEAGVVTRQPLWDVRLGLTPPEGGVEQEHETNRRSLRELFDESRNAVARDLNGRELVRPDGTKRCVNISVFPITLARGRLFGVIFRDVTETRQLETQLRHTEKMVAVGQLAGGIAHDFNNQLGGIMGYADLLRAEVQHDPQLTQFADNILRGARRAAELTAQLLAFARKGKVVTVDVDLHLIIGEVVSILSHSIDKRIVIDQRLRAKPCLTKGDPTQLQSALLNLAVNARDAMPDGGHLEISTTVVDLHGDQTARLRMPFEAGRYLRVRLADSGVGMTAEVQARLFEPFFTTKPPGKGTGMGLAAVYGTVRSHHGAIGVQSELGRGTTFDIYLPFAHPSGSVAPSGELERVVPGQGRILVVDDDPVVREATTLMLRKLGYDVVMSVDGKSAMDLFATMARAIDLVILDLVMPLMGGKETFRAMRAVHPGVRVLLASGFSLEGDAETLLGEGAVGFVQKPYGVTDLSRAVTQALAETRPPRQG